MSCMGRTGSCGVRRSLGLAVAVAVAALVLPVLALLATPTSASTAASPTEDPVYLVTLEGPGTAGDRGPVPAWIKRSTMLQAQAEVLESVDAQPVYQWTTALDGFAARLNTAQAEVLRQDPRVVQVERNAVRPLAGSPGAG